MKVTGIQIAGCTNVLMWAIKNGADIKNDVPLQSIINDEMYFLVRMENVNLLELFRLTQEYREKIRVINELTAEIPSDKMLSEYFPGTSFVNGVETKIADKAKEAITMFYNILFQMEIDEDIISKGALQLFLPMITRQFTVLIPFSFIDAINVMTEKEVSELFNETFEMNLSRLPEQEAHSFVNIIYTAFVRMTRILRYPDKYEKYLNVTKYMPLKADKSNSPYHFGLLNMYKFNNINGGQSACSVFQLDKDKWNSAIIQFNNLKSPLNVSFAVELPILYMQILLNLFDDTAIKVQYMSSMKDIINNGLAINNFDMPEMDEENEELITHKRNEVDAYNSRIAESNLAVINTLAMITSTKNTNTDEFVEYDETAVFAMLPSVYKTRAVITLRSDYINTYLKIGDPVLHEMLTKMIGIMNSIQNQISST